MSASVGFKAFRPASRPFTVDNDAAQNPAGFIPADALYVN